MVSTESSSEWLKHRTLIYDRSIDERRKQVWSPWWWNFIRWGIPLIIVWGVMGVFVPVMVQEVRYQARMTAKNFKIAFPRGSFLPSWSWEITPGWVTGYALEIPKLGIQESVIENVDTQNKSGYMSALTQGIALAVGSSVPGSLGTQYYFAHSSGLPFWGGRAVTFATLNKLVSGDEVMIYKEGKKYTYVVNNKHIVNPDDVSWLIGASTDEKVILQTCWPLGTNWKRLLVVAVPK